MKLIPEWRKCLKFYSTWVLIATGSINATWYSLPSEWTATLPQDIIQPITSGLMVLGFFARLIKQDD